MNVRPSWIADRFLHVLAVGEDWLEMTGWKTEDCTGHKWVRCIAPEDLDRFADTFQLHGAARTPFYIRYTALTNTGDRLPVHSVCTPMIDESGFFRGTRGLTWRVD
jgi:PAS domain S-box-containing protein